STQRPKRNGASSTPSIERTARIVRSSGKKLHVRVTLTPDSIQAQPQIARYICESLQPELIHVEMAYLGGRQKEPTLLSASQINKFVEAFLTAKKIAASYHVHWFMSGSRPSEIHGAYCNPFRQVLNLIPGGISTACFKTVNRYQISQNHFITGWYDQGADQFNLNDQQIAHFSEEYQKPQICQQCFLEYQCTHGCPDSCPVQKEPVSSSLCKISQQIACNSIYQVSTQIVFPSPTAIASGYAFSPFDWQP
ncbi:MAG TPA: hypothetical protein VHO90_15660, partial [Bacteroidales bacterium]|nr:hypothetical protein [Bacteroidales bacterium]